MYMYSTYFYLRHVVIVVTAVTMISLTPVKYNTYEILPALDLTQSVHAKISIGMQRGQILNF